MRSLIPSTSTMLSVKKKLQLLIKTKTEVSHGEPTLIQKKTKNLNQVIKKMDAFSSRKSKEKVYTNGI